MTDRYPDWTKEQLVLLLLWNKLNEAFDQGRSSLMIEVSKGSMLYEAGVSIATSPPTDLAAEIPELRGGGEAVAVFERLWREGLVHVAFGRQNPDSQTTMPVLQGLSRRGLLDIGKHPEQAQRLIEALEALRQNVERDPGLNDPERNQRLEAVAHIVTILNGSRDMAQFVVDRWAQGG